jgi:hypothetical protein
MDIQSLRRILTAFADSPADFDVNKGTVLLQLRGEYLEAKVVSRPGGLRVLENGDEFPAEVWIVNRVARLPMLADRILEHLPTEQFFVTPRGELSDQLDESPDDTQIVDNTTEAAFTFLGRRPGGTASVLYLTSDAGEGKTTLIYHLAREQARRYKAKEQDWLIVPVSLGGRTFMRFDDVIVGALMNRLRFPYLYYDAFLELVRLGVIVPALDGFEEMLVEGPAGDAISALGNLVEGMQSAGSVLIAARKAYFEYKDIQSQTRLFDSLGGQSVSFGCLALKRWDQAKFIEYAEKRGITNPYKVFQEVSKKLPANHPLLTRAVLVRRLLDIAESAEDRNQLLAGIEANPNDYFRSFIGTIIHREATEKWIDKLGEVAKPLISEDEHYELLASVALEMWGSNAEALRADVFDNVSDLFADSRRKAKVITRQVVERIKQHALIVKLDGNRFAFDHQEFYHFFLGEGIGNLLATGGTADIAHTLRQGQLPRLSVDTAARHLARLKIPVAEVIKTANEVCLNEPRTSYAKENLGGFLVRLLDASPATHLTLKDGSFPPDSLSGRVLSNIVFQDCYFQPSSLESTRLVNCRFINTEFERLDLYAGVAENTFLEDCNCRSVVPVNAETTIFAPARVTQALLQAGFLFDLASTPARSGVTVADQEMVLVEKMLRYFMRSTGLNENTLQLRFGEQAAQFFLEVLPKLEEAGVIETAKYSGRGQQKRYRLGMTRERINRAVEEAEGNFDRFIEQVSS